MKRLAILYIVLITFLVLSLPKPSFGAAVCQVVYGGGEVCQGQSLIKTGYPVAEPTTAPTPTSVQLTVPPTTNLPSTGTSIWGLLLIGLSGVGGVVLLLL